jgi:hypothetical protein
MAMNSRLYDAVYGWNDCLRLVFELQGTSPSLNDMCTFALNDTWLDLRPRLAAVANTCTYHVDESEADFSRRMAGVNAQLALMWANLVVFVTSVNDYIWLFDEEVLVMLGGRKAAQTSELIRWAEITVALERLVDELESLMSTFERIPHWEWPTFPGGQQQLEQLARPDLSLTRDALVRLRAKLEAAAGTD